MEDWVELEEKDDPEDFGSAGELEELEGVVRLLGEPVVGGLLNDDPIFLVRRAFQNKVLGNSMDVVSVGNCL